MLLTPALGTRFAGATDGLPNSADRQIDTQAQRGLAAQFVSGALLGAVWSPCIGPTLGAAIALASTGESLLRAALVMSAFAAGVSTLILALAYGAQSAIRKRQMRLRAIAENARPIVGAVFVLVGTALWFQLHHIVEAWLLSVLPPWLIDLSVSLWVLKGSAMQRRTFIAFSSAFALVPFTTRAATLSTPRDAEAAMKAGKVVVLDFWASWCSTCAAQERVLTSLRGETPAYD